MRLLLLHGFTATGRSWDPVRRLLDAQRYPEVVAPDLRAGPEESEPTKLKGSDPSPEMGMSAAAKSKSPRLKGSDPLLAAALKGSDPSLAGALRGSDPLVVCGYSMGGRIALLLALVVPERVRKLVLVSTTAGIEDAAQRAARREADERLAQAIERDGVGAFAERWGAQALFAGQPEAVRVAAHADRLRHDAGELAATLRALGTGAIEPVWDRLHELTMPATVLVGERDAKFRALGERLAAGLPQGELVVVEGAGHALHLETPQAVAKALLDP